MVTTNPKSLNKANSVPTRPNAKIWETAEQFFNAAEHIYQSENWSRLIYPLMVNYALSCELSLKASESFVKFSKVSLEEEYLIPAVNAESVVKSNSHNLVKIFELLNPPVQVALETEFIKVTGRELLPLLKKCPDYFIKARYPYEQIGGSYAVSDIRSLAEGLIKSVSTYGLSQGQ